MEGVGIGAGGGDPQAKIDGVEKISHAWITACRIHGLECKSHGEPRSNDGGLGAAGVETPSCVIRGVLLCEQHNIVSTAKCAVSAQAGDRQEQRIHSCAPAMSELKAQQTPGSNAIQILIKRGNLVRVQLRMLRSLIGSDANEPVGPQLDPIVSSCGSPTGYSPRIDNMVIGRARSETRVLEARVCEVISRCGGKRISKRQADADGPRQKWQCRFIHSKLPRPECIKARVASL